MKKTIKVLSLCLAATIILSFSACKSEKADMNSYSPSHSDKNIDLKGRTITIGTFSEMAPQSDDSKLKTDFRKKLNKLLIKRQKDTENKFNCKIDWITDSNSVYNNFNAGKPSSDIIFCGQYYDMDILGPIRNNRIIPLDDYINYNSGAYSGEVQNASLFRGKHYGVATSPIQISNSVLIYNKDLIKKADLTDPMELQTNNQWTWDAFLEILKATTKDLNGDGVTDQWGFAHDKYQDIFNVCIASNGGGYIDDKEGQLQFTLNSPESVEGIEFAKSLYINNKVSPDIALQPLSREQISKMFTSNNCAFLLDNYDGDPSELKFDVGAVVFPKGPKANEYMGFCLPGDIYAIPATAEDPESVAAVLAELFSTYDSSKDEYVSDEDVLKSTYNKDFIDTYKLASKNIKYAWFNKKSDYANTLKLIYGNIMLKNMSVDEAIAPQKSTIDKWINAFNQPPSN